FPRSPGGSTGAASGAPRRADRASRSARGKARYAAVRGRPWRGRVQEFLDFRDLRGGEIAAFLYDLEHVPPGREVMQLDAELAHRGARFGEDVVVEVDVDVLDYGAGFAQRLAEIDLRAAVGREVFDEERARALADVALDLRVASESLRLLAHVLHRQAEPVGDPRRVRNPGGLAAGHDVELLEACVPGERRDREFA